MSPEKLGVKSDAPVLGWFCRFDRIHALNFAPVFKVGNLIDYGRQASQYSRIGKAAFPWHVPIRDCKALGNRSGRTSLWEMPVDRV